MAKHRVLFIVPALLRAGAEMQIVQLVNGLPGDSFEKHLLSYLPYEELLASVDHESVTYHRVRRRRKIDLSVAREIGRVIDEQEIDVVHCTLEHALLYGMLGLAHATRKPQFVCAIHSTRQTSLKHRIADVLLYRHLLKRCAQVWFMCQSQCAIWTRRMPFLAERSKVIYNGVNADKFVRYGFEAAGRKLLESHGVPNDATVICSVAGLRPEKFHDVLLKSFARLISKNDRNCYLLLAGSGAMEGELRRLARELKLQSRIVFLGELADVRPLLSVAHCKVLASAAETFSMAMLEAMSMEVPVISTNVGGAAEAIEDRESGLLITPGRVDELANALSWMLIDESRRKIVAQVARRTVVEKFSYSRMVDRSYANLIEVF